MAYKQASNKFGPVLPGGQSKERKPASRIIHLQRKCKSAYYEPVEKSHSSLAVNAVLVSISPSALKVEAVSPSPLHVAGLWFCGSRIQPPSAEA